jgi:hypothetical protein
MGHLSALGLRKQSCSVPLLFTHKAIAVVQKVLVASVGAEEIGPPAIVLMRFRIVEIELLSANGVFDSDHLYTPSVEHHARNVEPRVGMHDLAGDRGSVIARKQHRDTSDLARVNRTSERRLGCSLGEKLIKMLNT